MIGPRTFLQPRCLDTAWTEVFSQPGRRALGVTIRGNDWKCGSGAGIPKHPSDRLHPLGLRPRSAVHSSYLLIELMTAGASRG